MGKNGLSSLLVYLVVWSVWSSGLSSLLVYLVFWSIWSYGLSSHLVYLVDKNRRGAMGKRRKNISRG